MVRRHTERAADTLRAWRIDEPKLELRFVEDAAGKEIHEVWIAEVGSLVASEDPYEVMGELVDAVTPVDEPPPPHVVSMRRTYLSWGADAASLTYLLEVAAAGVIGNAAYQGLLRVWKALAARHPVEWESIALDPDEAAEWARWRVAEAFSVSHEDVERLEVRGHTVREDGTQVVQLLLHDRRFEVELLQRDGLVRVMRSSWSDFG